MKYFQQLLICGIYGVSLTSLIFASEVHGRSPVSSNHPLPVALEPLVDSSFVSPNPSPTAATSPEQPMDNPSAEPTAAPTIRFTLTPTTYVSFVSMWVEQPVNGVSYTAYQADQLHYDAVFIATIAASCGTHIPTSAVVNLVVTDASNQSSTSHSKGNTFMNLRGAKELSVATVNLQYTVQVASSKTNTYDNLSTQLTHSVESGVFTTFLHYYSLNLDVFALFAASSSSVTTKDTTTYEPTESTSSDTSSGSVLPVAAIVGIVLGVMAGVVIGVRVFMLWCKWRQSQMDEILHEDTLQRRASKHSTKRRADRGASEKESIVNPLRESPRCLTGGDVL